MNITVITTTFEQINHDQLADITGLPIGHVSRGIGWCFRSIMDENGSIFAEVLGEPQASLPAFVEPGGGAVILCFYIIK